MNFTALSSYSPLAIAEGIPETVNVTVLPETLFTEALRPSGSASKKSEASLPAVTEVAISAP